MKKLLAILLSTLLLLALSACGKAYTCMKCGETTRKAYYDMAASKSQVMCEDCAHQYWMPLDYEQYRVE